MENENRINQPNPPNQEQEPVAETHLGALRRADVQYACCMQSLAFDGNFKPGQEKIDEETLRAIEQEETRQRQKDNNTADKHSQEEKTANWTKSFINELNELKKTANDTEQQELLIQLFGNEINQELGIYDSEEQESQVTEQERNQHKKITEDSKKLADKFRLTFFDREGIERENSNLISFLQEHIYGDKTKNAAIIQTLNKQEDILKMLCIKLYGSDTRLVNFQRSITETHDQAKLQQKWDSGIFDQSEQLSPSQRQTLRILETAVNTIVDRDKNPATPEIAAVNIMNIRKVLAIAENITRQNNQTDFLQHFLFEPDQDQLLMESIKKRSSPFQQLDALHFAVLGTHAKTLDYRQYIQGQGNQAKLKKSLEEIRNDLISTPEYEDLAIARENVYAIYQEMPDYPASPDQLKQFIFAATKLGVAPEDIKLHVMHQLLDQYQQQVTELTDEEKKSNFIDKKINPHKENIEKYTAKERTRKAVSFALRQLYDGQVNIELIDAITDANPPINTPDELKKLPEAIKQLIDNSPEYQLYKPILQARQTAIQQANHQLDQQLDTTDDTITSITRERLKREALENPGISHAILAPETINRNQLKTHREGNLLFVYDETLPGIEQSLQELTTIAQERASNLNLRQRQKKPITVLVLPDQNVPTSQTTNDGTVVLLKYQDQNANQSASAAVRRGEFRHEITHAELNQHFTASPLFAVREAPALGSAKDKGVHNSNEEQLAAGTPFRKEKSEENPYGVSRQEQQGYLLASYLYDLISSYYAAEPQQAAEIFNNLVYAESLRPNITVGGNPMKTYQDFTQHIYSLLGRNFIDLFAKEENKDLSNFMLRQGLINDKDENKEKEEDKQRRLLESAFKEPLSLANQERHIA